MYNYKELYNKYKSHKERKDSLEVKQYKLDLHLEEHPKDYQSVIQNFLVKSDIFREERALKEIEMRMEVWDESP